MAGDLPKPEQAREREETHWLYPSSYLPVSCHCLPLAKPRPEGRSPGSLRICTVQGSRERAEGQGRDLCKGYQVILR